MSENFGPATENMPEWTQDSGGNKKKTILAIALIAVAVIGAVAFFVYQNQKINASTMGYHDQSNRSVHRTVIK